MARLPTPGGDSGNWGSILNDYLQQSLKADGTLKENIVGSEQLANDAITAANIQDSSISEAQLDTSLQAKLNTPADWNTLSNKPTVIAAGTDATSARTAIGAASSASVVSKPATRVGMKPLSAPNGVFAATAFNQTQRTCVKLPFQASRWRIGFRNKSLRSNTLLTTPFTVTGVWVGEPVYDNGNGTLMRWQGNTINTPVQVEDTITVPTDGSRVWSNWISSAPFESGVDKVLSWGITSVATGTGYTSGNGVQGVTATGANQANVATLSSPTVSINAIKLDVVLEYEFAAPIQQVLYLGDSNTISYSGSRTPIPSTYNGSSLTGFTPGALPSETWPAMAGAMTGSSDINLGVGSAGLSDFNVDSSGLTQLWDRIPTGTQIDVAIVSLGINGVNGGLGGFSPHFRAINSYLRNTLGIGRIWWTTITPAGYSDRFARLTAPVSVGATNVSMDTSPIVGRIILDAGTNSEEVTVSSVSGSGPYTATLSAGTTYAHAVGEPVAWAEERMRRIINGLIRQMPDGISGCVDFERILEASPGSPVGDPRYVDGDGLHWARGASIEKARAVAALSAQPSLN